MLAHLIADFILQPYELVQLKRRRVGLAIHAGIHALVTAVLAAAILPRWWMIIPVVTVVHYWVDAMKVGHGPERGPWSLVAFLFDQAVHMAILAGAVLLSGLRLDGEVFYRSVTLTAVLHYAVPYITVAFAGAILLYQIALAFETRLNPAELLLPRLRVAGMAERMLTLTVVLFAVPWWWWLGAVSSVVQLGVNHRQPRRWVETVSGLTFSAVLGLLFR